MAGACLSICLMWSLPSAVTELMSHWSARSESNHNLSESYHSLSESCNKVYESYHTLVESYHTLLGGYLESSVCNRSWVTAPAKPMRDDDITWEVSVKPSLLTSGVWSAGQLVNSQSIHPSHRGWRTKDAYKQHYLPFSPYCRLAAADCVTELHHSNRR